MKESELERTLAAGLEQAGLGGYQREYRFHESRKWRFDFAWPLERVAAEADGGTWNGGRHSRGAGYQADCEKTNEAQLMGWIVLRFTRDMIYSGDALTTIADALGRARRGIL